MKVRPMHKFLMMLAGWIDRHHQDVIAFLKEENKVVREKPGIGLLKIRVSLVSGYIDLAKVGKVRRFHARRTDAANTTYGYYRTAGELVQYSVIGRSDGLTAPFTLAAVLLCNRMTTWQQSSLSFGSVC